MYTYRPFVPFNPRKPIRIYRRRLPHWRQEGCTYFVTVRLADSIPRQVLESWQSLRKQWLHANGLTDNLTPEAWQKSYRSIAPGVRRAFEREEAKRLFRKLDECLGSCALRDPELAALVAEAYAHFDEDRLQHGDLVIMPNHLHWVVMPLPGYDLEDLMASVNRFSARQVNRGLHRNGQCWYREPYDHLIRDRKELNRIRAYIEANPEKARLKPGEYLYHRAAWLDEQRTAGIPSGPRM